VESNFSGGNSDHPVWKNIIPLGFILKRNTSKRVIMVLPNIRCGGINLVPSNFKLLITDYDKL